jgi:hypothetical protein
LVLLGRCFSQITGNVVLTVPIFVVDDRRQITKLYVVMKGVDNAMNKYEPTENDDANPKSARVRPSGASCLTDKLVSEPAGGLGISEFFGRSIIPDQNASIGVESEQLTEDGVGNFNVVQFRSPFVSIGDIIAGIVLPDLAVRMRGDFQLPKVVAFAAGRDDSERP